jgi:hypothetical protein
MSEHSKATANPCPDVGPFPSDYSDLLPKGVPPFETSANSAPASKTWYFPIRLAAGNPTGVFIPKDFTYPKREETVDVILFFHGNKVGDFGKIATSNINYYLSGHYMKIDLREQLNASGKNALLVAPTMGAAPGHQLDSNPDLGIFAQPGGGDCFLDHVMQWLGHYDPRFNSVTIGKVVLAGHSGGGSPIHIQMNSMQTDICEVWCFDVVYWMLDDWIRFANTLAITHPNSLITFYHGVQSTPSYNALDDRAKSAGKKYSKEDRMTAGGKRNMNFVETGKADHFGALTDNFPKQLESSNCLSTL